MKNRGYQAEAVANEFKISREDQDAFAFNSHMKALGPSQEVAKAIGMDKHLC